LPRASLTGGLLHQWQQRNLAASLPLALRQLEGAGNLENMRLAVKADRAVQRAATCSTTRQCASWTPRWGTWCARCTWRRA
jgi:hypothetical protein